MTFAKKWTYGAPEICRNGNESTFRQNIGHSDIFRPSTNIAKPTYNINDIYHSSKIMLVLKYTKMTKIATNLLKLAPRVHT